METLSVAVLLFVLATAALWRARIHLKSRAQRLEESKKAAWVSLQCGSADLPSWIQNEERLSAFLFGAQRLALRKGVPHRKILETLATEHVFGQLIRFAGALEHRKATFAEQQLAVAETVAERFNYEERMRVASKIFFSGCSTDQKERQEI